MSSSRRSKLAASLEVELRTRRNGLTASLAILQDDDE